MRWSIDHIEFHLVSNLRYLLTKWAHTELHTVQWIATYYATTTTKHTKEFVIFFVCDWYARKCTAYRVPHTDSRLNLVENCVTFCPFLSFHTHTDTHRHENDKFNIIEFGGRHSTNTPNTSSARNCAKSNWMWNRCDRHDTMRWMEKNVTKLEISVARGQTSCWRYSLFNATDAQYSLFSIRSFHCKRYLISFIALSLIHDLMDRTELEKTTPCTVYNTRQNEIYTQTHRI